MHSVVFNCTNKKLIQVTRKSAHLQHVAVLCPPVFLGALSRHSPRKTKQNKQLQELQFNEM